MLKGYHYKLIKLKKSFTADQQKIQKTRERSRCAAVSHLFGAEEWEASAFLLFLLLCIVLNDFCCILLHIFCMSHSEVAILAEIAVEEIANIDTDLVDQETLRVRLFWGGNVRQ